MRLVECQFLEDDIELSVSREADHSLFRERESSYLLICCLSDVIAEPLPDEDALA